jgi:hypothetical protein
MKLAIRVRAIAKGNWFGTDQKLCKHTLLVILGNSEFISSRSVSGIGVIREIRPISPKVGFALLSIHGPELLS